MRKMQLFSLLLAACLLLVACVQTEAPPETTQPVLGHRIDETVLISNISPASGETVSLIGEYAAIFLEDYHFGKGPETVSKQNTVSLRKGPLYNDLTFSWECTGDYTGFTLAYATNKNFSDALTVETEEPTATLSNAFVGKTYFWQVVTHTTAGDNYSPVYSFQTALTRRIIYLEGVSNTRDIGGGYTEDGKHRIKQGLIYRGGNLDQITGQGMKKAVEIYKIKTDLDLRSKGSETDNMLYTDRSPVLYDEIQYINIPGVSYSSALPASSAMRSELEVFTKPENYPIYFHCLAGRDRGGTLAFLLGALLGIPEEELLADYELTYLTDKAYAAGDMRGHNNMIAFLDGFRKLEGETTQQKAQTYWKNIGLTQEQLDTFYSIMLEEP